MKGKRFTEEQIIAVLKEAEAGAKVMDVCRKYGISDATYYNWKAKYHGREISELKRPHSSLGDLTPYEFKEQMVLTG